MARKKQTNTNNNQTTTNAATNPAGSTPTAPTTNNAGTTTTTTNNTANTNNNQVIVPMPKVPFIQDWITNIIAKLERGVQYCVERESANPNAAPLTKSNIMSPLAEASIPLMLSQANAKSLETFIRSKNQTTWEDLSVKDLLTLLLMIYQTDSANESDPVNRFIGNFEKLGSEQLKSASAVMNTISKNHENHQC